MKSALPAAAPAARSPTNLVKRACLRYLCSVRVRKGADSVVSDSGRRSRLLASAPEAVSSHSIPGGLGHALLWQRPASTPLVFATTRPHSSVSKLAFQSVGLSSSGRVERRHSKQPHTVTRLTSLPCLSRRPASLSAAFLSIWFASVCHPPTFDLDSLKHHTPALKPSPLEPYVATDRHHHYSNKHHHRALTMSPSSDHNRSEVLR